MSLLPVVNSGIYKIVHFAYGAIRNDDGALGAKGNSSSPELEWRITRNQDHTYSFHVHDPKNPSAIGVAAHPGGTISEVKLNRDPADDENKHVPQNYSAQALWLLEPVAVPLPVNPPPAGY
ncbi:hypothetical protein FRC18_001061 [Serendipita sp. 400]|nr:hypothetical protein FRC18_001061 [Serendipita sp. 400]